MAAALALWLFVTAVSRRQPDESASAMQGNRGSRDNQQTERFRVRGCHDVAREAQCAGGPGEMPAPFETHSKQMIALCGYWDVMSEP
jgi:hypothetical protein